MILLVFSLLFLDAWVTGPSPFFFPIFHIYTNSGTNKQNKMVFIPHGNGNDEMLSCFALFLLLIPYFCLCHHPSAFIAPNICMKYSCCRLRVFFCSFMVLACLLFSLLTMLRWLTMMPSAPVTAVISAMS